MLHYEPAAAVAAADINLVGKGENGVKVTATVGTDKGDCGYKGTAIMLAETGLTLALAEPDTLPVQGGGVLTTASLAYKMLAVAAVVVVPSRTEAVAAAAVRIAVHIRLLVLQDSKHRDSFAATAAVYSVRDEYMSTALLLTRLTTVHTMPLRSVPTLLVCSSSSATLHRSPDNHYSFSCYNYSLLLRTATAASAAAAAGTTAARAAAVAAAAATAAAVTAAATATAATTAADPH
eukprot:13568-Heterococcus_DN1.PRE.1